MSENQSATALNSDKSKSPSSYLRDSFDSFNDNLVETILSFLTFNEKVLFESVSKRWKTHIYNRQKTFVFRRPEEESIDSLNRLFKSIEVIDFITGSAHYNGFNSINKFGLNSILKKCQSIEKVVLGIRVYLDFEIMDIICRKLSKLKCISFNPICLSKVDLDILGKKYGHQFERVIFEIYSIEYFGEYWKQFLFYCNNLKVISWNDIREELLQDNYYLPTLEVIEDYKLYLDYESVNKFKKICDKYCKTLKRLSICYITTDNREDNEKVSEFFENLFKLKRLRTLRLNFQFLEKDIKHFVNQISENLSELKSLMIENITVLSNFNLFITPFVGFNNLETLEINVFNFSITSEMDINGSVKCFKSMERLKKLNFSIDSIGNNVINNIGDQFFTDIDKYLPNLSFLSIGNNTNITDKTITQFSKLKKMKEFYLFNVKSCELITDESICALINGCPLLEKVILPSRVNITDKTVEALISVANNYHKRLYFGLSYSFNNYEIPSIDLNSFEIPENLIIDLNDIEY